MKKNILIILVLIFIAPLLKSCMNSCTCENPEGKIKEVDAEPSKKCSDYSDSTWTCS